jgi:hypothetical protein
MKPPPTVHTLRIAPATAACVIFSFPLNRFAQSDASHAIGSASCKLTTLAKKSQIGELKIDHMQVILKQTSPRIESPLLCPSSQSATFNIHSQYTHHGTTHPIQPTSGCLPTVLLSSRKCPTHEREGLLPRGRLHNQDCGRRRAVQMQREDTVNKR